MKVRPKDKLINIGSSREYSIKDYANKIIKILNFKMKVKFDNNKKFDGVYSKILDTNLAKKYGWKPKTLFKNAILKTYKDLMINYNNIRDY
jgi:nucleoside-diphosphate-sugar epimerase